MLLFLALLGTGCLSAPTDPAALPTVQAPPPALDLRATAVVPGEPVFLGVEGVPPGLTFRFFASLTPGPGPCAPGTNTCLSLQSPRLLGTATSNASGRAAFRVTAPLTLPEGRNAGFQAAWTHGTTAVVSDVEVRLIGDGDRDGTVQSLDCDDDDSAVAADTDGDGTCDRDDLCTGDDTTGDLDGDTTCDDVDACPLDVPGDLDANATCDHDDLCAALTTLTLSASAPGEALSASLPGLHPTVQAAATLGWSWARNGQPTGHTTATIPAGTTSSADTWSVSATAFFVDGSTCAGAASTTLTTVTPTCAAAALTPASPTSADDLVCACTNHVDPDGDTPLDPTCTFTVNGTVVQDGACTLPAGFGTSGQTVSCALYPQDADGTGTPATTSATLTNSPPTAPTLVDLTHEHSPFTVIRRDDTLTCTAYGGGVDPDGDTPILRYRWLLNGNLVVGNTPTTTYQAMRDVWGGPAQRGDVIRCDARYADATSTLGWISSPDLVVQNAPPVIEVDEVADARWNNTRTCTATVTDADGDAVTTTYQWTQTGYTSGLQGPIGAGALLDISEWPLMVGDGFSCTVTATDSYDTTTATTNEALVVGDDAEALNPVRLWAENGVGDASDTFTCQLGPIYDGDGEPFTLTYRWAVNGVSVRTETFSSDADSSLSGAFVAGDLVTCTAEVDGNSQSASVTVNNQAPTCTAEIVRSGANATCACAAGTYSDIDGDALASTSCAWVMTTSGASTSGCTVPITSLEGGTRRCDLTLTDARGGQTTLQDFERFSANDTIGWANPGVTLTPGTLSTADLDTTLTCSFHRTATSSAGRTVGYYVAWDNGQLWSPSVHGVNKTTTTLRELGYATTGATVRCAVYPNTGTFDWGTGTYGTSNVVTVTNGGAVPQSLTASHTGEIDQGETFTCAGAVNTGGDTLRVSVQGSSDAATWTDAQTTTTTSASGSASYAVPVGAYPYLRCRMTTTRAGVTRELNTTAAVPTIASVPLIYAAYFTPSASTPCQSREAVILFEDPDLDRFDRVPYEASAAWYINGSYAGTDTVTFDARWDFLQGVTIPMTWGVSDGDEVYAVTTLHKATSLTVSSTTDDGTVIGDGSTVTSVSLTAVARAGDTLTCTPGALLGACDATPTYVYTWTVDGVEQVGQTGNTFDSSVLGGGETVACGVRVGSAEGGFGATTSSADLRLGPTTWTITGAAGDRAGVSAAVIGDLDGDGYPELAVGAPNATADGRAQAGKVYVLPGTDAGGAFSLPTVDADPTAGTVLYGESGGWTATQTICRASSPNYITVCAPGVAGLSVEGDGEAPLGDGFGTRLTAAGDLDGDGVPDLLASAPYAFAHSQYLAGRVYLLPGDGLTDTTGLTASAVAAEGGAAWDGELGVWRTRLWNAGGVDLGYDGHNAGYGLAAGDFDGDGWPDAAIGAPLADPGALNGGRVYQLPLGPSANSGWLGSLTGALDFTATATTSYLTGRVLHGDSEQSYLAGQLGAHLTSVGDFDGDGLDDLFVGSGNWWTDSYLVSGAALTGDLDLNGDSELVRTIDPGTFTTSTPTAWITNPFQGIASGRHGLLMRGAGSGDLNADGKADLSVVYVENEGSGEQLEWVVFFGGADGDLDPNHPDAGIDGFVVEGRPGGGDIAPRMSVWGIGDHNGDGLDDLALSVQVKVGASFSPRLYLLWGKEDTATLTFADLEAGNGGAVLTELPAEVRHVGHGDLDDDGMSDLLIGMPEAASGAGTLVVRFGTMDGYRSWQRGTPADEQMAGSPAPESLFGDHGNDLLFGLGGADALRGGAGDDRLYVPDTSFRRLDGGDGTDTVRFTGGAQNLATAGSRVREIEIVDLRASASLDLTASAVLRLSNLRNDLTVIGSGSQTVRLLDDGWTLGPATTVSGLPARTVTSGEATVFVQEGLNLQVAPRLVTTALTTTELASVHAVIGRIVTEDADGDPVTVTADLSGLDGEIALSSDGRFLVVAGTLDHETAETLVIPLTLTDADGLQTVADLTVTVLDAPEAPAFSSDAVTATLPEAAITGTSLLTARATDPDDGDALTYTWLAEAQYDEDGVPVAAMPAFEVNATTGRVTVADGSWLDFESAPFIDLDVLVTDRTGLTDILRVEVSLYDLDTLPQTLTLPFFTETQSNLSFGPSGAVVQTVSGSATEDLAVSTEDGDVQSWTPGSSTPMSFGFESSGSMGIGASGTWEEGYLSAWLPVDVDLSLPDDIVYGTPFTIETDWNLNADASFWGRTLGFEAALQLNALNVGLDALSGETTQFFSSDRLNLTNGTLSFDLPAQDIVGGIADTIVDTSVDCAQSSFFDAAVSMQFDCATALGAATLASPLVGEEDLNWTNLDDNHVAEAEVAPVVSVDDLAFTSDMLVSAFTEAPFLDVPLDLDRVLSQLGVTNIGPWRGTVQLPLGNSGFHRFDYETWTAEFDLNARNHEFYVMTVANVVATLTFEGGTTVVGELREGLPPITLSADEDVNGDGRIDLDLSFAIDARVRRLGLQVLETTYSSTTMRVEYGLYTYTYDLQGNVTGQRLFTSNTIGPYDESNRTLLEVGNAQQSAWRLQGFDAVPASTTLQVAR